MGVEAFGHAPTTPVGDHFFATSSGWPWLWEFVRSIAPTAHYVPLWQGGNFGGLPAGMAQQVAAEIRQALNAVPPEGPAKSKLIVDNHNVFGGDEAGALRRRALDLAEFLEHSGGFWLQ
jgi:hypothetical protein